MNEEDSVDLFKKIYYNIANQNNNNNNNIRFFKKFKTRYILDRIKTFHDKYLYYDILDIENYFFLSQKYYFTIYNFIKRTKYKKYKIYNKYDLNYDVIDENDFTNSTKCANSTNSTNSTNNKDKLVLNVYKNKFIYRFTMNDIISIIKHNLYYYKDDSEILDNSNVNIKITLQCNTIKNPYTNEVLPISVMYNLYNMIYFNKKPMPYVLLIFYKSQFNLLNLNFNYKDYLIKNSFKQFVANIDKTFTHHYLKTILTDFLEYLHTYINYSTIKLTILQTLNDSEHLYQLANMLFDNSGVLMYNDLLARYYMCNNNHKSTYYRLLNYNMLIVNNKYNVLKTIFGINKSILIYLILNTNQCSINYRELMRINNINNSINNSTVGYSNINIINNNEIMEYNRLKYLVIKFYNNNYVIINNISNIMYSITKIVTNMYIIYFIYIIVRY